jgi:RND family efflux transporter MFP subunit
MFNKKIAHVLLVVSALSITVISQAKEIPAKPVKIDTVTTMSLAATADLMGTLHSRSHVEITAGVNGRVNWLAEPGSYIKQGQSLVKMDLLPLELRLAEQKAQIKRAEINMRYLKNEHQRLQQLRKTNATSQFQLDQAQSQYDLALADIEIANLKLKQVEDQFSRATVKAPYDGVVTERFVLAGSDVNRSNALLKFLDTEHLEVRVFVPIKYLAYVRRGNSLVLSDDKQTVTTKVSAVIPSADARSQTFEVRIKIPEHINEHWAAGQLVKVTVPVQHVSPSLTVHRDALILRKEGTYVVKVDSENKVHRLLVKVGQGTRDRVTVYGDLQDGDKVAVRGAERLTEGQQVLIQ